jgi:hypothetical protein
MTKDQQKWCTKPPVQGDAYGLFLKKREKLVLFMTYKKCRVEQYSLTGGDGWIGLRWEINKPKKIITMKERYNLGLPHYKICAV